MRSISAGGASRRTLAIGAGVLALTLFVMLRLASNAQAAELLYWDNYGGNPDTVAFANIDGTGGGLVNLGSSELESPEGMAYDSVTNRLFVTSPGKGQILAINLDGSGASPFTAPGAPMENPEGIAIDPTTRTIYWANDEKGKEAIVWAKLDGSAGGVLNTSGATLKVPCCRLAIDTVGGRIYWANEGGILSYAKLDNTGGGGDLNLSGSTVEVGGEGLAVDSAAGRVYFIGGKEIGYANVNGSGGGDVPIGTGVVNGPWGLAFDQSIGRLYWGNESNAKEAKNAFGFTNLAGTGGGISIIAAPVANPQDPVIIKSPTGTTVPAVTRSKGSRSKLSCSTGEWAADYPGGFVYQAPRTFAYQWTRNGKAIKGVVASAYSAKSAGKYVCVVTATNQAGSGSQSSAALNEKAAKLKLTTKKKAQVSAGGTATFKVKAVNQGDIGSKSARVCAKLSKSAKGDLKAPKCKSLGKLKGRGKRTATLKIKVGSSAGGTYKVTFQARGSAGKSAKAKILVH